MAEEPIWRDVEAADRQLAPELAAGDWKGPAPRFNLH
jgi:hypothetical protein